MKKAAGNEIPFEYMDTAQKKNENGYGVSWHQDGETHTFKTLDYEEFKTFIATLTEYEIIVHLRNTTAGDDSLENCHPFSLNDGVMFHNGTFNAFRSFTGTQSDTSKVADLLNKCSFSHITDVLPLIQNLAGTALNRLVFMDKTGKITIVNEKLGEWEDDNWYSNDYHKPDKTFLVFVYGTLKYGYHNHRVIEKATFRDYVSTKDKWAMIGDGMAFPYMLKKSEEGHNVEGELYEVDSAGLNALDRLEGYPTHYKRVLVDLVSDYDGEEYKALMYVKTRVQTWDLEKEFIKSF